ncbi:MAG: hypothetical protein ACFCVH_08555 [Alphaproteobacteria bacterium]
MDGGTPRPDLSLVGVGLYTARDAERFTGARQTAVRRWLRGYRARGRDHSALWSSQIDLGDDSLYLGFRDLTEIRVVAALVRERLSLRMVRRAIEIARDRFGMDRPLSTDRFRTDGKSIFLVLSKENEEMIDVFRDQYAMQRIIEPSFKKLDFDDAGEPVRWHVAPGIVLDPHRSFGQPIEAETGVPADILADAVAAEGSVKAAARVYSVPERAVRRALAFMDPDGVARAA